MIQNPGKEAKGKESGESAAAEKNPSAPPTISLPKGGGAIRGIGEKFAANPVTGTGSMTVPIATSPGRSGFGPQLSLSYDSGAGNGPFGFGWSLSLPAITRKTDKGLPHYQDAEESDVFILSGAEDLVPVLVQVGERWERETIPPRIVDSKAYRIQRYRPRIEGLFARIERWTNQDDPIDTFWRSISKDNITTWYGKSAESRIYDPADHSRIFSWLICQTHDDKGNVLIYGYQSEDSKNVDVTQAHERNRIDSFPSAQRYLKRIRYGNRKPYLPKLIESERWPEPPGATAEEGSEHWLFEAVFDYDEPHYQEQAPDTQGRIFATASPNVSRSTSWPVRNDPFSTYRAGFEVRTYRLCQRVLMFHHFPGEENVGKDCLVRSTDFTYESEDDPRNARVPIYSFLTSVTQSGYVRQGEQYLKKSLPPVEFTYSKPEVQDLVEEVDPESVENLPVGLDGAAYQWTDLHGEGIPGILTEQGSGWFYKRNLSPINEKGDNGTVQVAAKFAPIEQVAVRPNLALAGGAQFMDLAGDGQPDLVALDGPMPGLYEHDDEEGWEPFRLFTSRLNRDMRDPNLKFIDLDGDGHADVLITEEDTFVWHSSLAEEGFSPARRVTQALDEEKGPHIVFADGTQSIYLADLSGDGLTDIVRIRNGEVCYWPNLGYGRFGAKVTMDNAPWFDHPDQFDQKRIRLVDIDGSGTTDIIYLHRDGVRLYFNQSGNGWSQPNPLKVFPRVDEVASIMPIDLLGNSTACLVWSSPLPGDARRPMRYVNLMGKDKPHLLVKVKNNLGATTDVQYAPSTKFYLQDKRDGRPWITRLPFPVHVVERVSVTDQWRGTTFSTTYSYHHGYFDGVEREFRGFGRVEQLDTEDYGKFSAGNVASPYITQDKTLYQPPVKTITWFHTGACIDRARVISQLEHEYFPNWLVKAGYSIHPDYVFSERALAEPDLITQGLNAEEWREAMRACKGMTLRQEIYELDIDALTGEDPAEVPVRLFSAAIHNCQIQRLQPYGANRHAVFLVTESEALAYHYELDLRPRLLKPDPRIAHTLNLSINQYGQPLQTVAVAYPRVRPFHDTHPAPASPAGLQQLVRDVQDEPHLAYTETRYTDDFGDDAADRNKAKDSHRLRLPCEVKTYELTGIRPDDAGDRATTDRWDDVYFTLDELRAYRLSETLQSAGTPVGFLHYHLQPTSGACQKRIVEHARMLFFRDDPSDPQALKKAFPFGRMSRLGLPFQTYKLALTKDLLHRILADPARLTAAYTALNAQAVSGYSRGDTLFSNDPVPSPPPVEQYWIGSGIAGFAPDAAQHFYLPERYTDPFGNTTTLAYHRPYDLFIQSSVDAKGNVTAIAQERGKPRFDYRVLAPLEMVDLNGNHTEVSFDILGMVVASAIKGKKVGGRWQGDNLDGFTADLADPPAAAVVRFCTSLSANRTQARTWLGNASTRFIYHFGQRIDASGKTVWNSRMPGACGIVREKHVGQLATGETSALQLALECSDGSGNVLMKKVQAEPDPVTGATRWIVNGLTVLNNKGKPVKQYEPAFSPNFGCELPQANGVTPVMYYDAVGRIIRTESPDGSFSRVEFSPWDVTSFDPSDTAYDPVGGNHSDWYLRRKNPAHPHFAEFDNAEDRRAADLVKVHANTPSQVFFDSLGREVISVAHNKFAYPNGGPSGDERYVTFTKLDAEGKPLWIRDARGNLVMQYITPHKANNDPGDDIPYRIDAATARRIYSVPCYDIAGNLLFQHSMDAGDRWMLNDAAGKPLYAWDANERRESNGSTVTENRRFDTQYDELHRPTEQWLTINNGTRQMIERFTYGEGVTNAKANNLRGQLREHFDQSGRQTIRACDFKGNVLRVERQLASSYRAPVIGWQPNSATAGLDPETFTQINEYDALNRTARLYNWHRGTGSRVAVYEPAYNERGALKSEDLIVRSLKTATDYREDGQSRRTTAIDKITYDAKGQREKIEYGNGTITRYDYDPETFRLTQLRTTRPAYDPTFPSRRSQFKNDRVLQNLFYTYDPVGNITEIEDQAFKPVFFANGIAEPKSQYLYDSLYRLISATGRETAQGGDALKGGRDAVIANGFPITDQTLRRYTQTYEYDSVGNFLTMRHGVPSDSASGWTRAYTTATDSNRLLSTQHGITTINYGYDTHGNMQNLLNVAPAQYLRWDYRDMVRELDLVGGGRAYYNYDSGKQRSRKVIENQSGTKRWERIDLGGFERYRRYVGGNVVVEEIESHHLMDGSQRVLLVEDVIRTNNARLPLGPLYRYQYSNHLGSSCVELNDEAKIISYEEYHPYGTSAYRAVNSSIEAPLKRYRYTGMERDEESDLNYHHARFLSPAISRWISCDPSGVLDGSNRFCYVGCNPCRFVDKSGLKGVPGRYILPALRPPTPFRRAPSGALPPGNLSGGAPSQAGSPNLPLFFPPNPTSPQSGKDYIMRPEPLSEWQLYELENMNAFIEGDTWERTVAESPEGQANWAKFQREQLYLGRYHSWIHTLSNNGFISHEEYLRLRNNAYLGYIQMPSFETKPPESLQSPFASAQEELGRTDSDRHGTPALQSRPVPAGSATGTSPAGSGAFLENDKTVLSRSLTQVDLQVLVNRFVAELPEKDRRMIKRNKTIAVALMQDKEGEQHLLYSVSGNYKNPRIEAVAKRLGLTRWNPTPRAGERGPHGAPADAEQLLLEGHDENVILGVPAASRPYCPDCFCAIKK